jgi:hypothetical protein
LLKDSTACGSQAAASARIAEEAIPLEGTGTFGSFSAIRTRKVGAPEQV